jgi:hypothetical protein
MSDQPSIWSDPMGYFREQAERTAAEAGKDRYGKANDPGLFNNMLGAVTGATNAGTQEYRDLEQQNTLQGQFGSQLSLYGGAEVGLGEDEGDVGARLRKRKEAYEKEQRTKARNEAYNAPEAREARRLQAEQFAAGRTDVANQMALTRAEMAQGTSRFNQTMSRQLSQDAKAHQLQLMQFAETREQKANDLEYQKMRDRKADMQYNERMETLDRKDRRQAMSSIAAGLASLGAAFAM